MRKLPTFREDDGMTTVEYAIGTLAAAALAAVLYLIVTSDAVVAGLTALVERALSVKF
ncbi:DUF4244 domain-containing protein [Amycolatopsis azurea]|uniref:DUF4244 domain-containing protein n=1 Tax=Amycolatopsis azurea DSM 43854 TaxID=1238180 RepID=M2NHN4_9PSEU|nr:DUF4244 domain-containing protein [Amycolatopsis azurea]EMD21679.1 hypothetical protein C791_1147 [Amycolatopsis azurea DSM 43854]OOC08405.1 DUF4244 domain-containing protein [Amycolatopsis azurea DSM 43854]